MSDLAMRIDEAARAWRRFEGHPYEEAALAFLRATVEQARKSAAREQSK